MLVGLFAGSIAAVVAVLVSLPLHSPLANAFNSLTVAIASLIVGLAAGLLWNQLAENSGRMKYYASGMAAFFVVVAVVIALAGVLALPRLLSFGLPLAVIVFVLVGIFVPLYRRLPQAAAPWYTAALLVAALALGFGLVTQSDVESGDLSLPEREAGPAPTSRPAATAVATLVPTATPAPTVAADTGPVETPPAATEPAAATTKAPIPDPTSEPVATAVPTEPAAAAPETPDAQYVIGDGSEITFTVGEKLFSIPLRIEAVMRTEQLSGGINLDRSPSVIEVDLQSLTSDEQYRDRYVQRRMFPDHPVATLTVDDIGDLPDQFASGKEFEHEVDGTLNLRGQDFPISFDLTVRNDGDVLHVLGETMFTWDQFQITKPSARSVDWLEDEVFVKVLLQATQP